MAPKKTSKTVAASNRAELGQNDSQEASHESSFSFEEMNKRFKEKMTAKARVPNSAERRRDLALDVQAAYTDRTNKLRGDFQAAFDEHEAQLRALRRPNVERLIQLSQQKHELETKIDKCQAELIQAFEDTSQQLQASVNGRIDDLSS